MTIDTTRIADQLYDEMKDHLENQPYSIVCSCGADVEYGSNVDGDGDLSITLDDCPQCTDENGVDPYDVDIDIQCSECNETLSVTHREWDGSTICIDVDPCKCMQGSLKIGG